jgi:hypothetical protein
MVPDGQYTATVYLAIKENRYIDAVQLLTFELQVRQCYLLLPNIQQPSVKWSPSLL